MEIDQKKLDTKLGSLKEKTGLRIAELRKNAGMKQHELAALLGSKYPSLVGNWEKGNQLPEYAKLIRLTEIFDVNLAYLLCQSENPNSNRQPDAKLTYKVVPQITLSELNKIKFKNTKTLLKELHQNDQYDHYPLSREISENISAAALAIKISDQSMLLRSPVEYKSLFPGDIIIIDTELNPIPGEIVLAYIHSTKQFLLRLYKLLNINEFELVSYDTSWPALKGDNETITILGCYAGLIFRKSDLR